MVRTGKDLEKCRTKAIASENTRQISCKIETQENQKVVTGLSKNLTLYMHLPLTHPQRKPGEQTDGVSAVVVRVEIQVGQTERMMVVPPF
jgi:hypothetical protein